MKKKVQVHLLNTNDRNSNIWLTQPAERLIYNHLIKNHIHNYLPKHLYFTSDEEINQGDWVIEIYGNGNKKLTQANSMDVMINKELTLFQHKVIATTNPELYITGDSIGKIGDDFVEAYIKAYNEGMFLEYTSSSDGRFDKNALKLRSNGTVIISPIVEKMYSRDELLDIVVDYETRMSGYKEKSKEWYKTRIDAWLRNHYPQ